MCSPIRGSKGKGLPFLLPPRHHPPAPWTQDSRAAGLTSSVDSGPGEVPADDTGRKYPEGALFCLTLSRGPGRWGTSPNAPRLRGQGKDAAPRPGSVQRKVPTLCPRHVSDVLVCCLFSVWGWELLTVRYDGAGAGAPKCPSMVNG